MAHFKLLVLFMAILFLTFMAAVAHADSCTQTQIITQDGRLMTCINCCTGNVCSAQCF